MNTDGQQHERVDEPPEPAPGAADGRERTALVERLFREHNEALVRFLFARLRSYQTAREVAQEAYVRLLSLDEPGAVSYLRAFLFKTAANLAVDRLRLDDTQHRIAELPFFQSAEEERSPERQVAGAQTLQRLQRLIEALPLKCRRAFVMNRFDGKDFPTIAREMHLSERMVRTYVVRAMLHCRARLDLELTLEAKQTTQGLRDE